MSLRTNSSAIPTEVLPKPIFAKSAYYHPGDHRLISVLLLKYKKGENEETFLYPYLHRNEIQNVKHTLQQLTPSLSTGNFGRCRAKSIANEKFISSSADPMPKGLPRTKVNLECSFDGQHLPSPGPDDWLSPYLFTLTDRWRRRRRRLHRSKWQAFVNRTVINVHN